MKRTFNYLLFLFLIFIGNNVYSQRTIEGRILDGSLTPIPGVKIFDKDTIQLASSDFDGYFSTNIPPNTNKLIVASIGYEWSHYKISNECNILEIILLEDGVYHYNSAKKIDRIRRERFDNLPSLRLKAFEENLFNNKVQCYKQEFIPYKPQLDEIREELKEFKKLNKKEFKKLNIGDLVKIPFGIDQSDNEIRTYYSPCENCTEKDYDYVIEGEIVEKYRNKLTLEIKITKMKDYDFLKYRGEVLKVGSRFKYQMKIYEVIIQ